MYDPNDLITTDEACRVVGGTETPVDRSTLWRKVKSGVLSPPIGAGPGRKRWRRSVLMAEVLSGGRKAA
jgi:hypothetical protein